MCERDVAVQSEWEGKLALLMMKQIKTYSPADNQR